MGKILEDWARSSLLPNTKVGIFSLELLLILNVNSIEVQPVKEEQVQREDPQLSPPLVHVGHRHVLGRVVTFDFASEVSWPTSWPH